MTDLLKLIRFRQWRTYKIAPALGIFLLFRSNNPDAFNTKDIFHLALLTISLSVAATFTSISNDLADMESDSIAGKPNRLSGWMRTEVYQLLAVIISTGAATTLLLPGITLKMVCLLLWINWTLYSFEPFRAKNRGLAGPLLDAAGSHVLPCIMAVLLSGFRPESQPLLVFLAVLWSFLWRLRGIFWHQLYDFEYDQKSAVKTLTGVAGYSRTLFIGEKLLFPAETLAIVALLGLMQPLLLIPFFLCVVMEITGDVNGAVRRTVLQPGGMNLLFLTDFYTLVLPISIFLVRPVSDLAFACLFPVLFFSDYSERIFADYRILYKSWRSIKHKSANPKQGK